MSQKTRILIALGVLLAAILAIAGIEMVRGKRAAPQTAGDEPALAPGNIPITLDGKLVAAFTSEDLSELEMVSFVDAEEGKTQEGWRLHDILALYLDETTLSDAARIVVSSSSREKSVELTWGEVADPANWVMFDLSGRGTLKLVSVLERLDVRDEWIQDVDDIAVFPKR